MLNSGRRGRRAPDGYGILSVNEKFNQTNYPTPIIDSWAITDGSYNPIDDTALNTAGGQTVVIYGSGFVSGVTVSINGSNVSPVTLLDSGRITFTAPALSSATYTIYVSNSNGATAIYVPGLIYSGLPTWSSPAAGSIGANYETKSTSLLSSNTFIATGDAPITYSIVSGSLPSGVSLSSNGVLSGSLPATASSTTYSFTIRASDAQNQDSDRSFSLTINPDVITWVAPSQNGTLTVYETKPFSTPLSATSAAGYGVMYAANTLPTGITLATDTGAFSGYANTVGTTNVQLTATANTTNRYALSNVLFTVAQDTVTWSSPANNTTYALSQGSAMSPVTLTATSAAGYGVQYTANSLPTGVTLSNGTVSGTPTVTGTSTTEFTATANTTNRTSAVYINWSVSILGDVYFANNTLLLSANSQLQTASFVSDASNNNTQLTITGDTRAHNYTPYQHGYYSTWFDGSGQALYTSSFTGANFGSSNNFTIEFWVLWSSSTSSNQTIFELTGGTRIIMGRSSTGVRVYSNNVEKGFAANVRVGTWHHIAMVRNAGTITIYLNGVSGNSYADTTNWSFTTFYTGENSDGTEISPHHYISNLRILNGTAAYTTNFIPSTTPLTLVANTRLMICNSNTLGVDTSASKTAITVAGVPRVLPTNPFDTKYVANTQYYSTNFSSSAYVTAPITGGLGSGDFTIEGWVYLTSSFGNSGIFHIAPGSYLPSNGLGIALSFYGSGWHLFQQNTSDPSGLAPSPSLNRWYHFAMVKSGSTFKLYVDGVQVYSAADTTDYTSSTYLAIGAYYSSGYPFPGGHISNFRIVRGTALYSGSSTTVANFTVPTEPLTAIANTVFLGLQSDKLVDNSTNNFTITPSSVTAIKPLAVSPFTSLGYTSTPITTYGSAYFDGTGDYLSIPSSPAVQLGSSDFTLEAWVYPTSISSNGNPLFALDTNASYYAAVRFGYETGGAISLLMSTAGNSWALNLSSGLGTVKLFTWQHLALTRSGNSVRVFLNGVQQGATQTLSGTLMTGSNYWIGYLNAPSAQLVNGYISDARIVKGTALYTSNFVPQFTSQLTAVANTQLLTCQTNGAHNTYTAIDNSSTNNLLYRSGNAQMGTFSPYGDNWSYYFDGSSDMNFPTSSQYAFGTGAYTFEGWVNIPTGTNNKQITVQGSQFLLGTGGYGGSTVGCLRYYSAPSATTFTSSSYLIATNTWNHFAVVRESTSTNGFKMYINGMLVYVGTDTGNYGTSGVVNVASGGGSDYLPGYISNLRIVKGSAVYTTASTTVGTQIFTPSTSPLTAIPNTSLLTAQSNRFNDNSVNNFTATISNGTPKVQKFSPFGTLTVSKYYSTYFDGSGDYLTTPSFTSTLATWTMEFWLNTTSTTQYQTFVHRGNGATWSVTSIWDLYMTGTNSGVLQFLNGTGGVQLNGTTVINNGVWHHIAITYDGTNYRLFVDGKLDAYQAGSAMSTASYLFYIGYDPRNTRYTTGSISDFRFVDGSVVYSTSSTTTGATIFTPPTSPLTAIANTQLLTCQNSRLIDNSTNAYIIASAGDARPVAVSPFTPTANTGLGYSTSTFGGSMYFPDTSAYFTWYPGDASRPGDSQAFGTGDFTVDCWLYATTTAHNICLPASSTSTWGFLTYGNQVYWQEGGGNLGGAGYGTVPVNSWCHVAVSRANGLLKIFVNGVQVYSGSNSYNYSGQSANRYIGAGGGGGTPFYLSDFRVIKGTGIYTSNFYPGPAPATPVVYSNNSTTIANTAYSSLLASGTSGGVIDQSRNNNLQTVGDAKVTNFSPYNGSYYSNYFDGTGDYLSLPSNSAFAFGTGDFTVECWFYLTSSTSSQCLIDFRSSSGSSSGFFLGVVTSGYLQVWNGSNIIYYNAGITTGKWYHTSIVRSSGTITAYLNGTSVATASNSTNFSETVCKIGYSAGGEIITGNISNLRVVKGTAIAPPAGGPTAPLTAVSGTSLLTCQSNSFIDNSTNAFTITKNGDAAVKTFNPFGLNSGQSYYFDGTGDYLTSPSSPSMAFGTGDFTIEMWAWFNDITGRPEEGLIETRTTSAGTNQWLIYKTYASTTLSFYTGSADRISGVLPGARQWVHIAICRSSGSTKMYINGTQSGSTYADTNNYVSSGSTYIGCWYGTDKPFNGYLSDLRVTKGFARYTSNNTTYLNSGTPYLNK